MQMDFVVEEIEVVPRDSGMSAKINAQLRALNIGQSILIPPEHAGKGLHQLKVIRKKGYPCVFASKSQKDGSVRIGRVK